MSTQNQINLADKSVVELKALAFDLQNLVQYYSQAAQAVNQELQNRAKAEQEATLANAANAVAPAPVAEEKPKTKLKKA